MGAVQDIRYIGLTMTSEVGAPDSVVDVRVVAAGRQGRVVFGRTLHPDEHDSGEPIRFDPEAGEVLRFEPGAVAISLVDVERHAKVDSFGYAPVAGTLWTWLSVVAPVREAAALRYLLAAARRLDSACTLLALLRETLDAPSETFIQLRNRILVALGHAEMMCVALGRAVDMLIAMPEELGGPPDLPTVISSKADVLRAMRNAFEHIEDRALGRVRGRPAEVALSIFDQADLFRSRRLSYAGSSLDISDDILPIVQETRALLLRLAASDGPVQFNTEAIIYASQPAA